MSTVQFFDDPDMDFATRCVLSGVRHGMAEVGETLATAAKVADGDAGAWLDEFVALGRRCRARADAAAAAGHRYSAWNAALRAANYLYAGAWWAPATRSDGERLGLWHEHRASWDLAVAHWPTPVHPVALDHAGVTMPGLWFTSPVAPDAAAVVVLVGGLGTPVSDLCMTGLDGAIARGHHVLVVEGPGQGTPLYHHGHHLDDSWPDLIRTAVSTAARQPGVDPGAVGLVGVGAGALFVALGAARAADEGDATQPALLVVDPGVVDLGADAASALDAAAEPQARRLLAWSLTDPTGAADPADAVRVLARHRADPDRLGAIRCPTLVVTADEAFGFRGQDTALLGALRCPADHVQLHAADGAGADNGLDATQLHDAAVFDWWDARLDDGARRTGGASRHDGGSDG